MDIPTSSFKFNEGVFQMERIHEIQTRMNICKSFSLCKDPNTKIYGFQTWFSLLNSLYLEFAAKLTETELEEANKQRLYLKRNINNVVKFKPNQNGPGKKEIINYGVWYEVEEKLFLYELKLKQLMVKHKISSPEAKDPNKAVIN